MGEDRARTVLLAVTVRVAAGGCISEAGLTALPWGQVKYDKEGRDSTGCFLLGQLGLRGEGIESDEGRGGERWFELWLSFIEVPPWEPHRGILSEGTQVPGAGGRGLKTGG